MKRFTAPVMTVSIIVTAGLAGAVTGLLFFPRSLPFIDAFVSQNSQQLYATTDSNLQALAKSPVLTTIGWADLLPDTERRLIEQYQSTGARSLEDQLFSAMQASNDKDYQASMLSTSQVAALDGAAVTLNGFIVPLEANSQRQILRFFLVPYFGACLHFPPPAPNQMVYVSSAGGFTLADINSAYSVSGILHNAMYEDPLGTAAYVMEAVTIRRFSGQPDDLRSHPQN